MPKSVSYHRPVPLWALPLARVIFVCAVIVLTYNSVRPAGTSMGIAHFDKLLHAAAYFVLTGLLAVAMPKMRLIWVALLPCVFGAVMELAQGAMSSGRTGSLYDMLANIAGAVIAIGLWRIFVTYAAKRKT